MDIEPNKHPDSYESIKIRFKRCVFASLQAIRDGMIWLIPCLMLSSFALFLPVSVSLRQETERLGLNNSIHFMVR